MESSNEIKTVTNSYLTFKIGDELFASHVSNVNNIVEASKITKVTESPEYMRGVINLRGTVLPVVDLRIKFGMPETEFTTNTCILVTEILQDNNLVQVGALVDSVQEVLELKDEQILPPPTMGNNKTAKFIKGISRPSEEFIMILDMEVVFNVDEVHGLTSSVSQMKEQVKV